MKRILIMGISFFIFIQCENPIQVVKSHEVHQPEIIWQGRTGERYTEIAASASGRWLAFIVQQSDTETNSIKVEDDLGNNTKINKLVIFDLNSLKIQYQFDFKDTLITNIFWDPTEDRLLFLKNNQIQLFDVNTGSINCLNIPFNEHILMIRWGPSTKELAFLLPRGKNLKQGLYNLNTGRTIVLDKILPWEIKDYDWSYLGKYVAYTVPDSSKIYIYKYVNQSLVFTKRVNIYANLFRWMQNNTTFRQRIGDYALYKGDSTLGIFYFKPGNWDRLNYFQNQNIPDFSWASDGKHLFYIYQEDKNNFQIIREQIIYANE